MAVAAAVNNYPERAVDLVAWQFTGGLGKKSKVCNNDILNRKEAIFLKYPNLHLGHPVRSTVTRLERRKSRTLAKIYARNETYMRRKLIEDIEILLPNIDRGCSFQRRRLERILIRNNLIVAQLESENADISSILLNRETAKGIVPVPDAECK